MAPQNICGTLGHPWGQKHGIVLAPSPGWELKHKKTVYEKQLIKVTASNLPPRLLTGTSLAPDIRKNDPGASVGLHNILVRNYKRSITPEQHQNNQSVQNGVTGIIRIYNNI